VDAIQIDRSQKQVFIDQELCVECEVCYRADVCPSGALRRTELTWPRTIRAVFSNPLLVHKETRIPGRGTEEMKTNDVTGRFKQGQIGIAIELGRPGISTSFRDVEKVTKACAAHGVRFEPQNPMTHLLEDPARGTITPEVLDERVLSAIVEFEIDQSAALVVLKDLQAVSQEIDTVFSLNASQLVEPDGSLPMLELLKAEGFNPSPNGKNNMGLGRPAYDFFGTEE
jgi:hypothetical protein